MTHGVLSAKVLQVSSYGPPHPGGLEKVAARIFEEVKKRGVAIRWLMNDVPVLPPEPDTIRVPVWNQIEDRFGIPAFIPKPSACLHLYRAVKACDLVHLHEGYYLTCAAAAFFARVLGKKIVITVHVWDVPYKNPLVNLIQKIALNLLAIPVTRSANATATYNHIILRILAALKKNPRFIPNGVDPYFGQGRADTPVSDLRARYRLPQDKPVVIFAGRYNVKKGLPIVRAAARSLPDITFVLCGSGPDSESPDRWQLPNVLNLGWTGADKLRELFSCADLFLLPSHGEGFPLAIQEAMSCGLPCAVFEETWLALDDARDLFLILEDFPSVGDALRSFFTSPRGARNADNIATYARTHWSLAAMGDAYVNLYREALACP